MQACLLLQQEIKAFFQTLLGPGKSGSGKSPYLDGAVWRGRGAYIFALSPPGTPGSFLTGFAGCAAWLHLPESEGIYQSIVSSVKVSKPWFLIHISIIFFLLPSTSCSFILTPFESPNILGTALLRNESDFFPYGFNIPAVLLRCFEQCKTVENQLRS